VNDKKHNSHVDGSRVTPPLLVFGELIDLGQGTRIVKNKTRGLKANIVLEQVLSILVLVPFKAHGRDPALANANKKRFVCQY